MCNFPPPPPPPRCFKNKFVDRANSVQGTSLLLQRFQCQVREGEEGWREEGVREGGREGEREGGRETKGGREGGRKETEGRKREGFLYSMAKPLTSKMTAVMSYLWS